MKHCRLGLFVILMAAIGTLSAGCGGGGGGGGSDRTADQNACDALGLNPKIITGTKCDPAASPVVEIDLVNTDGTGGVCSGTLIANNFVLTAAHCFLAQPRSLTAGNGTVKAQGAVIYLHPEFGTSADGKELLNDVAIVKLENGLPLPTVPLLQSRAVRPDDIIAIFGYGLDEAGTLQVLRSGEMEVDTVDVDHIRAIFDGTGSNTCNGDSGGPALGQTSTGAWGIAGITSTGTSATCSPGDNSVFTNIGDPSVFNFISQIVPGVPTI